MLSKCTPKNVLSKCTPKNVLSKCTLRTCYPSAHPRMCYPSAHSERDIQVHSITLAPLRTLVLHSYSCTIRALLRNLVHYSCTATYSRAPISCTTPTCAPLRTRAPLCNLVHYSCTAMYSRAPVSCTTRAPLRNLVHHSRAPLKYSRALPSFTTLMHHSHSNALSALLTYSRAPLNHS